MRRVLHVSNPINPIMKLLATRALINARSLMVANVAYLRFKYGIVFESNQHVQTACIRKHHCLHCLDKDKCGVLSVFKIYKNVTVMELQYQVSMHTKYEFIACILGTLNVFTIMI